MRPTSVLGLVALAALVGVVSWVLTGVVYNSLPPLPAYAPVTLGVLAAAEAYWAWAIRSRVHRRGSPRVRPMAALWVARSLALAKASSLVGALALGAYAGFLAYVGEKIHAPEHSHDALVSGAGVGTALLLSVTALLLERACRVPPRDEPPDEPHDGG